MSPPDPVELLGVKAKSEDLGGADVDLPRDGAGLGGLARLRRLHLEALDNEGRGNGLSCLSTTALRAAAQPAHSARLSPDVARALGINDRGQVRLCAPTRRELLRSGGADKDLAKILGSVVAALAALAGVLLGAAKVQGATLAATLVVGGIVFLVALWSCWRQVRERLDNDR